MVPASKSELVNTFVKVVLLAVVGSDVVGDSVGSVVVTGCGVVALGGVGAAEGGEVVARTEGASVVTVAVDGDWEGLDAEG